MSADVGWAVMVTLCIVAVLFWLAAIWCTINDGLREVETFCVISAQGFTIAAILVAAYNFYQTIGFQ